MWLPKSHSWKQKRYPQKSPWNLPMFCKAEILTKWHGVYFGSKNLGVPQWKVVQSCWWQTRNPGATQKVEVEVGSLSHYLQGFIHSRWLFGIGISEPSTVSWWAGLLVDMLVNFAQRLVNIATLHRDKVRLDLLLTSSSCCWIEAWVLVSIIFYIHLYLVKIPILTNIR